MDVWILSLPPEHMNLIAMSHYFKWRLRFSYKLDIQTYYVYTSCNGLANSGYAIIIPCPCEGKNVSNCLQGGGIQSTPCGCRIYFAAIFAGCLFDLKLNDYVMVGYFNFPDALKIGTKFWSCWKKLTTIQVYQNIQINVFSKFCFFFYWLFAKHVCCL